MSRKNHLIIPAIPEAYPTERLESILNPEDLHFYVLIDGKTSLDTLANLTGIASSQLLERLEQLARKGVVELYTKEKPSKKNPSPQKKPYPLPENSYPDEASSTPSYLAPREDPFPPSDTSSSPLSLDSLEAKELFEHKEQNLFFQDNLDLEAPLFLSEENHPYPSQQSPQQTRAAHHFTSPSLEELLPTHDLETFSSPSKDDFSPLLSDSLEFPLETIEDPVDSSTHHAFLAPEELFLPEETHYHYEKTDEKGEHSFLSRSEFPTDEFDELPYQEAFFSSEVDSYASFSPSSDEKKTSEIASSDVENALQSSSKPSSISKEETYSPKNQETNDVQTSTEPLQDDGEKTNMRETNESLRKMSTLFSEDSEIFETNESLRKMSETARQEQLPKETSEELYRISTKKSELEETGDLIEPFGDSSAQSLATFSNTSSFKTGKSLALRRIFRTDDLSQYLKWPQSARRKKKSHKS